MCSIEEYEVVDRMQREKHIIIKIIEYTTLKRKGSIYDSIKTITSYKSASSYVTPHSMHRIVAFAVSDPQISSRNIQELITLSRYTLLYDIQSHSRNSTDTFILSQSLSRLDMLPHGVRGTMYHLLLLQEDQMMISVVDHQAYRGYHVPP